MVDLRLFALPSFTNGLGSQTLYFLGMTSVWVLVALYAQEAAGMSAFATELLGALSAVLAAMAARWAGRRVVRLSRKLVIGDQLIAAIGLVLSAGLILAQTHRGLSLLWLTLTLGVYGLGQGATVSPNRTLTLQAVPIAGADSAGALISTSQRVDFSIGIDVVTGVVFAALPRTSWSTAAVAGFALITLLVIAAIAVGIRDLRLSGTGSVAGSQGPVTARVWFAPSCSVPCAVHCRRNR